MLQPLSGLAGLSPLQIQTPAQPVVQQDTGNMFDDWWTKIAVATGQVSQADVDAAKATSNSTTQTPKAPSISPVTPIKTSIGDILGGAVSGITGGLVPPTSGDAILHPIDTATSFIFTSRLVFLIIGLLLVGAGLFQFKTTQTVINTGTKVAKAGAEIFA